MFFKGSRYERVPTLELRDGKGQVVRYKGIRWIRPARPVGTHLVQQGERLDHISHRYFQDPERFWSICDANLALWPNDLLIATGRLLRVPPVED